MRQPKRRPYRVQEPPYCIQIELTEGCNLRCAFCGLQGIRDEKEKLYKEMTPDTLRNLLTSVVRNGWNPRLEFAMHGEPTMHRDYVGMIRVARESAPRLQIMMTSNGGGILRKPGALANVTALFEAGLNVLALDDYQGVGVVPKIREAVWERIPGVTYYDYPDNLAGSPHVRRKRSAKVLTIVRDIVQATKGNHAVLTNHAGSGGPGLAEPLAERCAKPFREIGVRWDGNVAMCCNDWRGQHKCGNVNDTDISDIWQSAAFGAAREMLYAGNRNFGPCAVCDYHSYRNGLLPDKFGKEKMHAPDAQTLADVQAALAGAPYTEPRLRPWEIKRGRE